MNVDNALAQARARLLHDLHATLPTTPVHVDILENVVAERGEWVGPWPAGAEFLTCLVAQDLQEQLEESDGRWPLCRLDGSHQLHVTPDLGADPYWVCEDCEKVVAAVGEL